MAVPPPSKHVLRQILKKQRHERISSKSELEVAESALACSRHASTALADARIVAAYIPIGNEMDTAPVIAELVRRGVEVALPHVINRSDPLRFLAWTPDTPLAAGPFGLQQPADEALSLRPDVILTPLLGFDRVGNRLGYGAGHYDRAFAQHPDARRIGLAWSFQEIEQVPADEWDVPLHAIATEREWITI